MASKKKQLPQLSGPRVTQEVIDKAATLTKQVRPLGQPRAVQEDVVAALIYVATAKSAAAALVKYNPELGTALNALDDD